jgi:transcriptional regulator with XRE-family HTH domain
MSHIFSDMLTPSLILEKARTTAGLTQQDLAERALTSQPAIARLEQGRVSPTFSTLERLVAAAGFDLRLELVPRAPADPVIEAYKRDVDRTLLRENLKKTVDDRLRSLDELRRLAAEVRRAVRGAE